MSWAEVKKINSDMSKPLDVLFRQLLIEQRSVAASDETLKVVSNGDTYLYTTESELGSFQANVDGTVRIKVNAKATTSPTTYTYVRVYKDGSLFDTGVISNSKLSTVYKEYSFDINVKAGSVYSLAACESEAAGGRVIIGNVKVCGSLGASSLIT